MSEAPLEKALSLHRAGALEDAARAYEALISSNPAHNEARYFWGLCLHQLGQHADALVQLQKVSAPLSHEATFLFNLSLVQQASGDHAAALMTLQTLIDAGNRDPQVLNAYGVCLRHTDKLQDAIRVLEDLCSKTPDFAGAWFNLGNALFAEGKASAAISAFETAHRLSPDETDIARNLAAALQSVGRLSDARKILERILKKSPTDAATLNNLGLIQRQLGDHARARRSLEDALDNDPSSADAAYNLGTICADLNDLPTAQQHFKNALSIRPDFVKARWAAAFSLPQIYASEEMRTQARHHWQTELLQVTGARLPEVGSPGIIPYLDALSEFTPFALAYQGQNDLAMMSAWGDFAGDIAARAFPAASDPGDIPERTRKRVAFVSAHWRAHTIQRLFGHWLSDIDHDQIEAVLVSTSGPGDDATKELCAHADIAIIDVQSTAELVKSVHDLHADAIVYPDIGMDPRTQVLAALRMAPRQFMSWGHPVTSGLPTIDGFLSSDLMEPPDGANHYREALIRLPGLSVWYNRPTVPATAGPPVTFLCAQSLFKIAPRQDHIFARILAACPGATLGFTAHPIPEVTTAFANRLDRALRRYKVDPDQVLTFMPPCSRTDFLARVRAANVVLDTFDWSGGNTSLETLAMGTPIVTYPGPFMRGRHTMAMLAKIACDDLITENEDAYVALAVKLATDDGYLRHTVNKINARSEALFYEPEVGSALTSILVGD